MSKTIQTHICVIANHWGHLMRDLRCHATWIATKDASSWIVCYAQVCFLREMYFSQTVAKKHVFHSLLWICMKIKMVQQSSSRGRNHNRCRCHRLHRGNILTWNSCYFTWLEHRFINNTKLFSISVQSHISNNNTNIEPNSHPFIAIPNCICQDLTCLEFFAGCLIF